MRTPALLWCAASSLCALAVVGGRQLPPPAGAVQELVERGSAPDWIALPSHGQLEVAYGLKFDVMHSVVISRSTPREAVLVGALRNRGRDPVRVRVTLRYLGPDGETLRPVAENAAPVSAVSAGDLLPLRFPLVSADRLSGRAVIYRLVIDAALAATPVPLNGARVTLTETRSLGRRRGVRIGGSVELGADSMPRDPADVVLTLMLMDADGRVLDVVAARPFRASHGRRAESLWPFDVRTSMPVPRRVHEVKTWVTSWPDPAAGDAGTQRGAPE